MSYERLKSPQIDGTWDDGAVVTNPGSNAILETTGALVAGDYFISFLFWATASATFVIAWRDAADATDLHSFQVPIPTASLVQLVFPTKITLLDQQRITVRNVTSITGNAQATILTSLITG